MKPALVRLLSSVIVVTSVFVGAVGVASLPACADLKTATPADGDGGSALTSSGASSSGNGTSSSSSSSSSSGASSTTSSSGGTSSSSSSSSSSSGASSGTVTAGFGPGPHGSLPTGYCCESDSDCRFRHCVDTGAGKTCLDSCDHDSGCQRPDLTGFTCDATQGNDGFCKAPNGFACVAAASYERGTKVPGNCCTATGDGIAGLECEGSLCVAVGDGPFVCTNACSLPKDCSGPFTCQTEVGQCFPANQTYTCN